MSYTSPYRTLLNVKKNIDLTFAMYDDYTFTNTLYTNIYIDYTRYYLHRYSKAIKYKLGKIKDKIYLNTPIVKSISNSSLSDLQEFKKNNSSLVKL